MEKLLAEMIVEDSEYRIFGDYSMNEDHQLGFEALRAKILKDGTYENYEPEGYTWTGRKYIVEDMLTDCISKLILCCGICEVKYLDHGLLDFVALFHNDIVTTVNGLKIPRKVVYSVFLQEVVLKLVTSDFIYYVNDDIVLMLRTDTHEVVSDNSFACEALGYSLENIETGKEKLIWCSVESLVPHQA